MGKLIVILVEAALELIPTSIADHPSILHYKRKKGKRSDQLLLDRAYHHFAMKHLPEAEKRGRPDIIHLTLLNMLNTPLNKRGLLECYIHTREDKVIQVDPEIRITRHYDRFLGLIEQLYTLGEVPPAAKPLLKIEDSTLAQLIEKVNVTKVVGLSMHGSFRPLKEVCEDISQLPRVAVLIGGFPKGQYKKTHLQLMDELYKIYRERLDAWSIACRVIHQFELASGISF
jgi:rRNA small subunit pseudouridine methyltransferase Nep1